MKRLIVTLAAAAALMQPAWAVPPRFHYQARLTDSGGAPINGAATLFVGIYQGGSAGAANSGAKMYEETAAVTASQGVVDHAVGGGTPTFGSALTPDMFRFTGDMFLQVAVNSASNVVLPRQLLESVPYALVSADGETRIALPGPLPISITTPGSYVLTGNLSTSTETGITVDSDDVTLDLNGYAVTHTKAALVSVDGVQVTANRENIVVRNGSLRGWQYGVNAQNCRNSRFEQLQVYDSSRSGIAAGEQCIVRDCVVRLCGYSGITGKDGCSVSNCAVRLANQTNYLSGGIHLGEGCVLANSTVMYTDGNGITTGNACTLANCSATSCSANYNPSTGAAGILVGDACTLRGCTAYGSGDRAIYTGNGCTLRDCTAYWCQSMGIITGDACTLSGCASRYGYLGIDAGNGCTLKGCTASNNAADGISIWFYSVAENCAAHSNDASGIFVGLGGMADRCAAGDNLDWGICLSEGATARGNTVYANHSYGIVGNATYSHIDSNLARSNNGGPGAMQILSTGGHNVITRNMGMVSGTATDIVGPSVTTGNVATSSNPHANYLP